MLSGLVPTWTLLAALTAGLILGVLASRLFTRSSTVPAVPSPQEPALLAEAPAPEVVSQEEPASQPAVREREEHVQEEHRWQQVERLPNREGNIAARH